MDITNLISVEKFMAGVSVDVPNELEEGLGTLCSVYPVTLRQIANIGAKNFYSYLNIFTLKKEDVDEYFAQQDIEGEKPDLTPFQFLLVMTQIDSQYLDSVLEAFKLFLHEETVTFLRTNEAIVLGKIEDKRIIYNDQFEVIKQIVESANTLDTQAADARMDNPSDAKAAQIIKKLKEGRKMREKAKSNSELSFSDLVASLAAGGNGLNILNVWDLPFYAFNDQFKRMQMKEEYENTYKSLLAGADPKKVKIRYWVDTIQDKEK